MIRPARSFFTLANKALDIVCGILCCVMIFGMLAIMFVVALCLVWEAWDPPSETEQAKHNAMWEARDDVPLEYRQEMTAKLRLLEEPREPSTLAQTNH